MSALPPGNLDLVFFTQDPLERFPFMLHQEGGGGMQVRIATPAHGAEPVQLSGDLPESWPCVQCMVCGVGTGVRRLNGAIETFAPDLVRCAVARWAALSDHALQVELPRSLVRHMLKHAVNRAVLLKLCYLPVRHLRIQW